MTKPLVGNTDDLISEYWTGKAKEKNKAIQLKNSKSIAKSFHGCQNAKNMTSKSGNSHY